MIASRILMFATTAGVLAAGALAASPAHANAKLGEQGTTTLAAERIAGLGITYLTYPDSEYDGSSRDADVVYGFSLFGSNLIDNSIKVSAMGGGAPLDRWGPRLAFDTFLRDGVSFGGSAFLSATAMKDEEETFLTLGVAPRVGFSTETTGGTTIWFKAGFTAAYGSLDEDSAYALDLNLQCDFVFPITDSFGWTLSPTLDVPLSAQRSGGGDYRDARATPVSLGLNVGILGWY